MNSKRAVSLSESRTCTMHSLIKGDAEPTTIYNKHIYNTLKYGPDDKYKTCLPLKRLHAHHHHIHIAFYIITQVVQADTS